ncbi:nitroreductase family protein [Paracoccus sp. N5]|uniref:nitroreductase family protein n=1 Tax=Paracoccus sp. N5 TaxID=1101189 RepID=UPI0032046D18
MRKRRSVRAYLDRPVPRATVEEICRLARSAPSGANLQPGHFHVLTGSALADLVTGCRPRSTPAPRRHANIPISPSRCRPG